MGPVFDALVVSGKKVLSTYSEIQGPPLERAQVAQACVENTPPSGNVALELHGLCFQGVQHGRYTVWVVCRETGVPADMVADVVAELWPSGGAGSPGDLHSACRLVFDGRRRTVGFAQACAATAALGTQRAREEVWCSRRPPCHSEYQWVLLVGIIVLSLFIILLAWYDSRQ